MSLSTEELNLLKANSLSVADAREVANQITSDETAGGVFPNANSGDFSNPNIEAFKQKWCPWWPVARILLTIAKIFTKPRIDEVIDKLLQLGDQYCNP